MNIFLKHKCTVLLFVVLSLVVGSSVVSAAAQQATSNRVVRAGLLSEKRSRVRLLGVKRPRAVLGLRLNFSLEAEGLQRYENRRRVECRNGFAVGGWVLNGVTAEKEKIKQADQSMLEDDADSDVNEITDPFFSAITDGDEGYVKSLLERAAMRGLEHLERLLSQNNTEDGTYATPIHEMVSYGNIGMLLAVFHVIEHRVPRGKQWDFIAKLFSARNIWNNRPLTDCDNDAVKLLVHTEVLRLTNMDVDFSSPVVCDGYVA